MVFFNVCDVFYLLVSNWFHYGDSFICIIRIVLIIVPKDSDVIDPRNSYYY
jgi:hypothetical protein